MTSPDRAVRIATRASRLALWQARHVAALLRSADPVCSVELVEVSTHGDRDRTEALSQLGGQGVFTREVQHAVLDGRADLAVHSLKDLPTEPADGLTLAGVPQRGPRYDVLVFPDQQSGGTASLDELRPQSRIGTGSLRRQAQLLHYRSDLEMLEIRGNVETRLRKLNDGEYDAVVLAQAGLDRLELSQNRPLLLLRPPVMFPAVGQAALGLECRTEDDATIARLASITDPAAMTEVTAERACLHALRAGCHAPVGVVAALDDDQLELQGVVLSGDGRTRVAASVTGTAASADSTGSALAAALLEKGAAELIASP